MSNALHGFLFISESKNVFGETALYQNKTSSSKKYQVWLAK